MDRRGGGGGKVGASRGGAGRSIRSGRESLVSMASGGKMGRLVGGLAMAR